MRSNALEVTFQYSNNHSLKIKQHMAIIIIHCTKYFTGKKLFLKTRYGNVKEYLYLGKYLKNCLRRGFVFRGQNIANMSGTSKSYKWT